MAHLAATRGAPGVRCAPQLLLALLVVLATAAPRPAAALFGSSKTPEEKLLDWLVKKGGKFNAAIETHDGLRGVYATKDIPALGLIAKIPLSAALWMPLQLKNITQQGAHLAKEAAKGASSAYAPYLEALPSLKDPHHTVNYYTFPKDYLPHVDAEPIVATIKTLQDRTEKYWNDNKEELTKAGVTLDKLKAALVTVVTRYYAILHKGELYSIMLPFLDFANHYRSCMTFHEYKACAYTGDDDADAEPDPSEPEADDPKFHIDEWGKDEICMFWRTGEEISEGDEVCNTYGYITPDQAFFEYGFLLEDSPPQLSRADAAGATEASIADVHDEVPTFDGTVAEVEAEVQRITDLIAKLEAGAAAEAAAKPAAVDKDGAVLAGLRELRKQRVKALRREAARLENVAASKRKDAEDGGEAAKAAPAAKKAPAAKESAAEAAEEGGDRTEL